MRSVGLAALAVLLFVGAFAVVRAQGGDLRAELAALEQAAAAARAAQDEEPERELPARGAPIHRIPLITVTCPVFVRHPPGFVDDYWAGVGVHSGPGPHEDAWQPYGTIEEVAEILAEREERLGFQRPTFAFDGFDAIYRGSAETAARIRKYVEEDLGSRVMRTAIVEVDWEMGGGRGDASFRARFLSLVGARSKFWVGRQRVFLSDTDVTATAGPSGMADPRNERRFSGELVLPEIVAAPDGVLADVNFWSVRLDSPVRRLATRESGALDYPSARVSAARAQAKLTPDRWETLHRGAGTLRVRARALDRGGTR